MTDEGHCHNCGCDVYSKDVETYSIVDWIPQLQANVFVTAYCRACWMKMFGLPS